MTHNKFDVSIQSFELINICGTSVRVNITCLIEDIYPYCHQHKRLVAEILLEARQAVSCGGSFHGRVASCGRVAGGRHKALGIRRWAAFGGCISLIRCKISYNIRSVFLLRIGKGIKSNKMVARPFRNLKYSPLDLG